MANRDRDEFENRVIKGVNITKIDMIIYSLTLTLAVYCLS